MEGTELSRFGTECREISRVLRSVSRTKQAMRVKKIVAPGMQSAGKSSLIEGITGIPLPRDSGTCTRGPIHIRSTQNEEVQWLAVVKLLMEYDDANEGSLLPRPQTTKFKELAADQRDQIASVIREAQRALLDESAGDFTKNTVLVEVQGRDALDCELIDIPGVIATHEKEAYVTAIRDMTKRYMQLPDSIILLCLPANTDIENNEVIQMARTCDPEQKRSIGVITKCDTMESGNEDRWLKVFQGKDETHARKFGYFAVVRPSTQDLQKGVDSSAADEKETAWFESNSIGKKFNHVDTDRCSTLKLSKFLSNLIRVDLHMQMPYIRSEMVNDLNCTKRQIKDLDMEISESNVREFLSDKVDAFADIFNSRLFEQVANPTFQKIHSHLVSLQERIVKAAPVLQLGNGKQYPEGVESMAVWTLQGVEELLMSNRGRQISDDVPKYTAVIRVVQKSLELWEDPASECIQACKKEMDDLCQICGQNTFSDHHKELTKTVVVHAQNLIQHQFEVVRFWLEQSLEAVGVTSEETSGLGALFTLRKDDMERLYSEHLDKIRHNAKDYERGAEIVARAMAFFDVKWPCFVESLFHTVDMNLCKSSCRQLKQLLRRSLHINDERVPGKELLSLVYDEAFVGRHRELKEKLQQEQEALRRIDEYLSAQQKNDAIFLQNGAVHPHLMSLAQSSGGTGTADDSMPASPSVNRAPSTRWLSRGSEVVLSTLPSRRNRSGLLD